MDVLAKELFIEIIKEAKVETAKEMKQSISSAVDELFKKIDCLGEVNYLDKIKAMIMAKEFETVQSISALENREGHYNYIWHEADRCRNGKSGDGFRIRNPEAEVREAKDEDAQRLEKLQEKLMALIAIEEAIVIFE